MKRFKLIFKRFLEAEKVVIPVGVDDTNVVPASKRVSSSMQLMTTSIEGVIEANEKLAKTSSDKRIGMLRLTQAGIGRFNASKDLVTKLSQNPHVSDKTRTYLSTLLAETKSKGYDNLKEEYPQSLDRNRVSGMMSLGDKLSKAGIKAAAEEQKYYNKNAKEGLKLLEQNAKESIKNNQAMEKYGQTMQKIDEKTKTASNSTSKFTQTMKKLAGAAVRWRILYGAFSRIWNTLASTVDKAAAYEEAINLYTVALGDYADKASEWRDRISEALYLDPKYVMQYTGALYNLVQGLGVSADAAYVMSTNLTQLAYDMSSYLNIDVQSAYDKIQSAMTGQSRAVASAGIAMQQASLQELAYSMGIKTLVSEMTQAEKTYLRYIQIMRSTTKMQGDLGRTIVTPENALRVIRQQFEMLGRAIGQVFIPIIMKAIPYIMALTQLLTELAKKLSASLGFEIAKIDYSGLTSADTAVEDTFNNINKSAAGSAKSVKDSINRTLAAFDELNVVESESKGSGGGAGVGSPAENIASLTPYIEGYDMLKDLTSGFDKEVGKAKENLLKVWEVIKNIGKAFLIIKGIKAIASIGNFIGKIQQGITEGKGFYGVLGKLGQGIKNTFPKWGGLAGYVATLVASFKICGGVAKDFNNEQIDTAEAIKKTTIAMSALGLAGVALAGPLGGAAAIVAGVAGIVVTSVKQIKAECDRIEEQAQRMVDEENLAKFFDDTGFHAQLLVDDINNLNSSTSEYAQKIKTVKEKLEETSNNLRTAGDNFKYVHDKVLESEQDGKLIDDIKNSVKQYKKAIDENKTAQIEYHKAVIDHLAEEGYLTKKEQEDITKSLITEIKKRALAQSNFVDEYSKLEQDWNSGKIKSQEEYNKKLDELYLKYKGLVPSTDGLGKSVASLNSAMSAKIDFSNYNEVIKLWEKLKDGYKKGAEEITKTKEANDAFYEKALLDNQVLIDEIEKLPEAQRKAKEGRLKELNDERESLLKLQKSAAEQSEADMETLSATFKNYSGLLLAQMAQSNVAFTDELKGTTKDIRNTLRDMGDVDISKSIKPRLQEYLAAIKKEGGNVGVQTLAIVSKWVQKIDDETWDTLSGGTQKGMKVYGSGFRESYESIFEGILPTTKEYSTKITMTMFNSLLDGTTKMTEVGNKTGIAYNNALKSTLNDTYTIGTKLVDECISGIEQEAGLSTKPGGAALINKGIGRTGMQLGKTMTNSFIAELSNSRKTMSDGVSDLVSDVQSSLDKKPFTLKFNSTQSSFNSILKTLQSFSSKWGIGITDILNNTKLSFGGLAFKDGKLTFNPFKMINIKFFEQGGYPTSGDLFLANENGRAEYITSLGNKTAVANQDQMVSALTNAIVQGMSNIETNRQPGVTQVYIGNEKVYEGHGQYQNRQAERYGTTYVKI